MDVDRRGDDRTLNNWIADSLLLGVQEAKQRGEETRASCDDNEDDTNRSRDTIMSAHVPRPVCYLPALMRRQVRCWLSGD
jgi:hypothetical protein